MTQTSEKEILKQVSTVLKEPLPKNGAPHVIVIVYSKESWSVNKAAPKGKG